MESSNPALDGLACVVCAAEFGAGVPSIPVGWSETGSQVFACAGHYEQSSTHDKEG